MSTAPAKKSAAKPSAAKTRAAANTTTTTSTPVADDPGSSGDPTAPDTGTRDKVAAGSPAAAAPSAKGAKAQAQAQHDKEIRRANELGIEGADKMKREELQAELQRPEFFSSLLDRDTTHFDNVHYGYVENRLVINGGSSPLRQAAAQAALEALGANVTVGTTWDDSTEAVKAFQRAHDLDETGDIDRATWDAIGDDLFGTG